MGKEVLLTVIVPAYNHEKYILQCLESIAKQTFRNFQWIVVDDCSKDRTTDIIRANQEQYGYEMFLHENNMGLSATLTQILSEYAKGKYIAICASDDYWLPEKLEKQINFMESHPKYAMCYGKTHYVDTNSNLISYNDKILYKSGNIFTEIITQKFHPPVNYIMKKEILEDLGYYKSGVIAEDFFMNCLISYQYPIGYIPEYLGFYRVEALEKKRDPFKLYKSHEETIRLFENDPIYPKALGLHYGRCFLAFSMYNKYKLMSLGYLIKSLGYISLIDIVRGFVHLFRYWKRINA